MGFGREIQRLLAGFLIAFLGIACAAAYWAATGSDTLLSRDDNPRRVIAEESLQRGALYDRNGTPMAISVVQLNGRVQRRYLEPSTYGALGYFSNRYGVAGAEAAYNTVLRGDDLKINLAQTLTNQLLHRPQRGSDVELSIDLSVQNAISNAMRGQTGAVIVMSIPSGDILGMVSLPRYDPNLLDEQWQTLTIDPGNPYFNRALQSRYQPGAALQTPLMAAALLMDRPLDDPIADATAPVQLGSLTLECAARLPALDLSLREAYAFACPHPFQELAEQMQIDVIQATFDTFQLENTPTLPGFVVLNADGTAETPMPSTTPTPTLLNSSSYVDNALGQGTQTVTPLMMAMIAAAIINDGNTPQPNALLAVRAPENTEWIPSVTTSPTIPITTAGTASRMQDLMRGAVANGAAQNAGRPDIDIGGHAALAYSGDSTLAWFIGFATLGGRDAVAVAVVLENSRDPGLAADIGGTALQSAGDAFRAAASTPR
ncbi:MAG: penicillin-binding transpeptidase domain-containing protein [Anaerolineae bacterium]